jgi:hypothetical protein
VGPTTSNHAIVESATGKIITYVQDGQKYTIASINNELADNAVYFGKYKQLTTTTTGQILLRAMMDLEEIANLTDFLCESFRCSAEELNERLVVLMPTEDFSKYVING